MDHAGRFHIMCTVFRLLADSYVRVVPRNQPQRDYPQPEDDIPYIITHLTHWVNSYVVANNNLRTGGTHIVMSHDQNENRRVVPSTIREAIADLYPDLWLGKKDARVPVTWVVMFLHDILPDRTLPNWQLFECSHRCIEYNERLAIPRLHACIDPECLVWESKSENQSRGNRLCTAQCAHHCGNIVCLCQNYHNPHCI